MGRVVACTNLTLDGVMQGPGRADEDVRDGFTHGGWAEPYAGMTNAGHVFGNAGALLFGRRTYLDFADVWPKRATSPFTPWLNNTPKFVASRTLREPLPWVNSTLLQGDVSTAVTQLKRTMDNDILILGSGELIRSLMKANVIDEYLLLIHPLVLGAGRLLFGDGAEARLKLVNSSATPKGVILATYQPAVEEH